MEEYASNKPEVNMTIHIMQGAKYRTLIMELVLEVLK